MKKEIFIERAREKHGDKYDYSLVPNEVNTKKRVNIICPIHGVFSQFASAHLFGSGCKYCAAKLKGEKQRLTQEEFIKKVKEIHGDKYDWSKTIYITNKKQVTIICPIHGEVKIYPLSLLRGCKCHYCAKHEYTTEEIKNLILKNYSSNELDLSKVVFKGFRTRVKVICKKCGKIHDILPQSLLKGKFHCECQKPKSSLERKVENLLINEKITFESQKRFDWLGKQSLDFYIPSKNIAIECQGKQHFGEGGWTKNEYKRKEYFKEISERDLHKYNLCFEHNIKILYFSNIKLKGEYISEIYTDINKIIEIINK